MWINIYRYDSYHHHLTIDEREIQNLENRKSFAKLLEKEQQFKTANQKTTRHNIVLQKIVLPHRRLMKCNKIEKGD